MHRPISRIGICSACIALRELEGHHCIPQSFEKATTSSPMAHLCHKCHRELHDRIDPMGQQPRDVFLDLTIQFLWFKRN